MYKNEGGRRMKAEVDGKTDFILPSIMHSSYLNSWQSQCLFCLGRMFKMIFFFVAMQNDSFLKLFMLDLEDIFRII